MPVVTKPLPAAAVISRQGKLEANVQGVIRFHSSVTFAESTSQTSILSLVRNHHVWIARNGDCRINISVLLDGEFVCGKEKVSRIVRWVENYDVWGIRFDSLDHGYQLTCYCSYGTLSVYGYGIAVICLNFLHLSYHFRFNILI